MQKSEYELVRQVQSRHWWWLGRERIIVSVVQKYVDLSEKLEIADVGCGFGANISMLRQFGDVTGLELNAEALRTVKFRWGESVNAISWKSPDPIKMAFNFMLLGDVLEHIPDDKEAIGWVCEHLQDNGYALITVPAHKFLWTQMDEVLNHHRRYSKKSLLSLFDDRFEILYCSYYNMFLLPVKICFVFFDRIKQSLFPNSIKRSYNDLPPFLINSAFKHILTLESSLIPKIVLPFGASLICIVRKKSTQPVSKNYI